MRQPGPASPRRITQMISWFKAASSFVSNLLLLSMPSSAVFLAAVLFLADARLFDASTIHGCDADLSDRLYLTEQLV